jgi:hypothetical protein
MKYVYLLLLLSCRNQPGVTKQTQAASQPVPSFVGHQADSICSTHFSLLFSVDSVLHDSLNELFVTKRADEPLLNFNQKLGTPLYYSNAGDTIILSVVFFSQATNRFSIQALRERNDTLIVQTGAGVKPSVGFTHTLHLFGMRLLNKGRMRPVIILGK